MTKLTKLMTLLPMVALGAACNGASPTAPDNLVAPEAGAAYDSSSKAIDAMPGSCKNITGVDLRLLATPQQSVLIQATYVSLGGSVIRCAAPVWSSKPRGALIADTNPFRTRVNPDFKSVTVFATAPNGVQGHIDIGPATESMAIGCKNITGVELKLVATPQRGTLIRASYVAFGGPIDTRCGAPVWTSNPQNALIADTNPFRTRVKPVFRLVTVFAMAPNGVLGKITVTP